jgi:hypothetical protein
MPFQGVQTVRVDHQGNLDLGKEGSEQGKDGGTSAQSRPEADNVFALNQLEELALSNFGQTSLIVLRQAGRQVAGVGSRDNGLDFSRDGQVYQAGAPAQGRAGTENGGTRHALAPGDDEHTAKRPLITVRGPGGQGRKMSNDFTGWRLHVRGPLNSLFPFSF